MSRYRIDSGVPWLINDAGLIVGYVDNNGAEHSAEFGVTVPQDTPALNAAVASAAMGVSIYSDYDANNLPQTALIDGITWTLAWNADKTINTRSALGVTFTAQYAGPAGVFSGFVKS